MKYSKVKRKIIYTFNVILFNVLNFFHKAYYKKIRKYSDNFDLYENRLNYCDNNSNVIVSMTTIPSRMEKIKYNLTSVFTQSKMPQKVFLWLGCTNNENIREIERFQKFGLEVRRCEDADKKPHTKYFFTARQFKNNTIITLDDDIIYKKDVIRKLVKNSEKHPKDIICNRAHFVTYNKNKISSYNFWEFNSQFRRKTSNRLFFTGVGGVLYPKGFFDNVVLDEKAIMNSLNNDDIYLNIHARLKGIGIHKTHLIYVDDFLIDGSQDISLSELNVDGNQNDKLMYKIAEYYKIDLDNIFR